MARLIYSRPAGRFRHRREYQLNCGLNFRVFSNPHVPDDPSVKAIGFLHQHEVFLVTLTEILKKRDLFGSTVSWLSDFSEVEKRDITGIVFPQGDLDTIIQIIETFLDELSAVGELESIIAAN